MKSAVRFIALTCLLISAFGAFASCLPCKEEIDNGMGILGATLYAGSVVDLPQARPIDKLAPVFYARGVETIFSPLAKAFLYGEHGKLSKAQTAKLMEQIDLQCYRADDFTAWALSADPTAEKLAAWTTKILKWAKDDQVFYTKLSAELKD